MGEVLFSILLFFGIIAVTVVLFGGWVIVMVFRFLRRAIFGVHERPRAAAVALRCPRSQCGAANPPHARFCRRCGQEIPAPHEIHYRRAAML